MVLELIAGLNDPSSRKVAAQKLAEYFGASYLIIFIKDREKNILLPGPGFSQTWKNVNEWTSFLACCQSKYCQAKVHYPDKSHILSAVGFPCSDDAVAVFIGGTPAQQDLEPFRKLLPLVIALLKQEHDVLSKKKRAISKKETLKSEKLTQTIELLRQKLYNAISTQEKDKEAIQLLKNNKNEFINVASHELKTPITSLKAYIQLIAIKLKLEDNQLSKFIDKANTQVDRLIFLVNDLLDVSKIQSGGLDFNFTKFNCLEMLKKCKNAVQETTNTHQIIIKAEPQADIEMIGDKTRLEQVVSNLLSNAIKYSPKGDKVILELLKKKNQFQLIITDFGIGIPPEHIPHIFERSFRVNEMANKFFGLGLGLYISSEIIKHHAGNIEVKSTPGQGSTFWITFPLDSSINNVNPHRSPFSN